MRESKFQNELIKEIQLIFPDAIVLRTETAYIDSVRVTQGIPDIVVLYKNKWAALECKRSEEASFRPNQKYYINKFCQLSYAASIFPENKEDVIDEIRKAFGA